MALADRLGARREYQLRVDAILAALSDEDRATLEAALADSQFSSYKIAKALSDEGYSCSGTAVDNWRRAR